MARPDMAELVDRFYEPLYRFAYSLAGARHHAEDLTQETFYLWAEKGSQLRARILAGKQVSKPVNAVPFRAWLAVAAAIAFLLAVGLSLMRPSSATVAEFGADAARFVYEKWDHRFDLQESEIGRIRQWLADQKTGSPLDVPASVAGRKMYGCKVYDWNGRKATLVCFSADDGGTIHLVMTARDAMSDPPGETPVHFRQGGYNMAAWSRGSQVYVAMTQSPQAELEKIL